MSSLFNPDGTLTEEGMKANREAHARGKDKVKRASKSPGRSRGFNFYGDFEVQ